MNPYPSPMSKRLIFIIKTITEHYNMRNSLKTLVETKGIKKEFKFITPVSQYIEEKYGELIDVLDDSNIQEILSEITKLDDNMYCLGSLVIYKSNNTIQSYNMYRYIKIDVYDGNEKGLSKFTIDLSGNTVNLNELYYITDYAGYLNHLEELTQIKKARHIKDMREQLEREESFELKRQADVIEDNALRSEFDLKPNEDVCNVKRFITIFDEKDRTKQFKAFSELLEDIQW